MSQPIIIERSFDGSFDAWAALWTMPGAERRVAYALEDEGFAVYVPMKRRLSHGKLVGRRAVVAGYLFVRATISTPEEWERLLHVDGVGGPVFAGLRVAAISDAEIERLQRSQFETARRELVWWLVDNCQITVGRPSKARRNSAQRRKSRKFKARAKAAIEIREAA